MPLLWLIDDTPQLHSIAEATVELVAGWTYTGFLSGEEALAEFQALIPAALPAVILMDYYIGDERGDRVTTQLRACESGNRRPVIIGYSSVRSASVAIVAAGADLILPKITNAAGINPSLLTYLRSWPVF